MSLNNPKTVFGISQRLVSWWEFIDLLDTVYGSSVS